jgi:uncharacterized protein with von Willebrand factor type A (vWA) domain
MVTVSCGGRGESPAKDPPRQESLCSTFRQIDWDAPPVTATDTDDQVAQKFARGSADERSLESAATGTLKNQLAAKRLANERYRERYLAERRSAGGGEALSKRALAAGFYDTR